MKTSTVGFVAAVAIAAATTTVQADAARSQPTEGSANAPLATLAHSALPTSTQAAALARLASGSPTLPDALAVTDFLIPQPMASAAYQDVLRFDFDKVATAAVDATGTRISHIDVDLTGAITVVVLKGTLSPAGQQLLEGSFGTSSVNVVEGDRVVPLTAVTGGDEIRSDTPLTGGTLIARCSKGWTSKQNVSGTDHWYLVTAGHCLAVYGQGNYKHAPNDTPHNPSFGFQGAPEIYYTGNSNVYADARGLALGTGSRPTAANSPGVNSNQGYQGIVSQWDTTNFPINSRNYCKYGYHSGQSCGTLVAYTSFPETSELDGSTINVLYGMKIDQGLQQACTGDSGGPVWGQYYPGGVSAMGIVSAGDGAPFSGDGNCYRYLYASNLPTTLSALSETLVTS